jgi:hypothetical protein
MNKFVVVALLSSGLLMSGCVPTYYSEASLYAPGGALADKHDGPQLLASVDANSIKAMFPAGTPRDRLAQALGTAMTNTSNSDGTTSQVFMHSFTSYSRKFVETEILNVVYDDKAQVSKLELTKSRSTF